MGCKSLTYNTIEQTLKVAYSKNLTAQNSCVATFGNTENLHVNYYPFGMLQPNRHFSGDKNSTRGYQGQEKDDELKGEGNSLNYTFRMHDPRIGRFFAVDPLASKYPWYTPYQFSGNKVIHKVELEGLEEGNPPTLYHGTSIDNANNILDGGFNATENGKYSNYNWFSTEAGTTSGGRASSDIFIGVKGVDLSTAKVISTEMTTGWKQEIMKQMGITGSDLKKLKSTNEESYNKIIGEIYGKVYEKVGQYMDANKAQLYYLEKDGTYAMTDKLANSLKKVSFKGKVTELMKSRTRTAKPGEAKFAENVANGKKISYAKVGGTAIILIAAASDIYEIYTSTNKSYTITKKVYGWSGSAMGAYAATALVGGQCGPQALAPEEVFTVPIAGFIGGMTGYFVGETVHEYVYKFLISKGL